MKDITEDIKGAFLNDLLALLAKYGATLEAHDCGPDFASGDDDIRMTVTIPSKYDKNTRTWHNKTNIDLGSYLTSS